MAELVDRSAAFRRAKRLAVGVREDDCTDVKLRMGLRPGQVIAGEIGSGASGYTAIGEPVSPVARAAADRAGDGRHPTMPTNLRAMGLTAARDLKVELIYLGMHELISELMKPQRAE